MTNPEPPPGWSTDQSWHPMPTAGSPPPTTPMYPPISGGTGQQPYDPSQPYPQTAYGAPYAAGYGYGYPAVAAPPTNGMAIGSMVVSIVSIVGLCAYGFGGLLGILGAILGHVARRQIKERGEGGDGMALAGIIMGWIATGIGLLIVAFVVFIIWLAVTSEPSSTQGLSPFLPAVIG
jgi:hypothetical protein